MFKAFGNLKKLKFKSKAYTSALDEALQVQIRQAARAWLKAIIARGLPPIYTGTARGTLKPLGQYLRVAVPLSPIVAYRKGKGPDVGASLGKFAFLARNFRYTFEWNTDLFYYHINEFFSFVPGFHFRTPIPWHSMEIGEAAFLEYVETVLHERIPKVKDFIEVIDTKIG
jgi:hypothetical protein